MRKILFSLPILGLLAGACGPTHQSKLNEAWNKANDPDIMGLDELTQANRYVSEFKLLPKRGRLETTPWSDDYWPTYKGGISHRWAMASDEAGAIAYPLTPFAELTPEKIAVLSPAEKLDLFQNQSQYPTVEAERRRTSVLATIEGQDAFDPNYKIPTWEGLCHAWAPAAILFKEPKPVTVTNANGVQIPFGSSDVKALLTYFLNAVESTYTPFVGERCNISFAELEGLSVAEREAKKNSKACRDVNAGAFHLILTNQIALLKQSFVVDVTRDQEVWNQPVSGFSIKVLETTKGKSPGAAKGTVEEVRVSTRMTYVVEISPNAEAVKPETKRADYEYRLELDEKGKIIGGAWISDERPDFLWRQSLPAFTPEFKAIEDIYNQSIAE